MKDWKDILYDKIKNEPTKGIFKDNNKQIKNNKMKNIKFNLETIIKVVIVTFIIVTLTLVTIELFSDLTLLNRAF